MKHIVKCSICGESFDRDSEPFEQTSARRYAHKECFDKYGKKKTQDELDLEELEDYIKKLFNESYVNAKIRKQIKEYRQEYNYTYTGILKSLIYWYNIKGNSIEDSNTGIGIVPYIYEQSRQYYYALYLAQLSNSNKDIEQYRPKIKHIKIKPPSKDQKKKIKLFNLGDE